MLPESMFWLLLTGEVPTAAEVRLLSKQLAERGELSQRDKDLIDGFPKTLHPMTQTGMAVAA